MTMLPIKQLIFTSCTITKEDAQFVVDFLKKGDHHFCEIKLFETKWTREKDNWTDYEQEWKQRISGEIESLTWSNQFQKDRNELIEFLAGDASDDAKLNIIYRESCLPVYESDTLHWTDDQKLWYAVILAAIRYDNDHEYVLGCGGPNMLYSLIKKFPEYLKVV